MFFNFLEVILLFANSSVGRIILLMYLGFVYAFRISDDVMYPGGITGDMSVPVRLKLRLVRVVSNLSAFVLIPLIIFAWISGYFAELQATAQGNDGWSREFVVVCCSLLVVFACSALTIVFTPARMNVIAGVSISLVEAILVVEVFVWITSYMRSRVEIDSRPSTLLELIVPSLG